MEKTLILHCWDCGAKTVPSHKGLGANLDACGIFTWCPKCKKYPSDFYENKSEDQKTRPKCMVQIKKRN